MSGYPDSMVEAEWVTSASPAAVWSVLADGWAYPTWVVGAARMRAVERTWPAAGSRLHHSVGLWPALIDDTTSVLASIPGSYLALRARGWPAGEARVDIRLDPSGTGTRMTMTEDVTAGPGRLVPPVVRKAMLATRNRESLRRLALLAEGRGPGGSPVPAQPVSPAR